MKLVTFILAISAASLLGETVLHVVAGRLVQTEIPEKVAARMTDKWTIVVSSPEVLEELGADSAEVLHKAAWMFPSKSGNNRFRNGTVRLQNGIYEISRPITWPGRTNLIGGGSSIFDSGTRLSYVGEQTDQPLIKVLAANKRGHWNSNFSQNFRDFALHCNEECSGLMWGGAHSSEIKTVRVKSPVKNGYGIWVRKGSNSVALRDVQVWCAGDRGGQRPVEERNTITSFRFDSFTHGAVEACKAEQGGIGYEMNNGSWVFSLCYSEANLRTLVKRGNQGYISGTIVIHAAQVDPEWSKRIYYEFETPRSWGEFAGQARDSWEGGYLSKKLDDNDKWQPAYTELVGPKINQHHIPYHFDLNPKK